MSTAKVTELIASSTDSIEDAIRAGVAKAHETVRNIESVWVKEQGARVQDGKVVEFRVTMKVVFVID